MKAMLETQEKERSRVALDMHDELGPLLSAVKLRVGSLKNVVGEMYVQDAAETQELLDDAIRQIRRIIRDLVPKNIEEKGLTGVLQDLKQHVEAMTPLAFHLSLDGFHERLPTPAETNIYRIILEIVNNAIKHSGATQLQVAISERAGHLDLVIEDNGRGFDADAAYQGSGLKNIRTRVSMCRGTCDLQSTADKGTHYFITFEKRFLAS